MKTQGSKSILATGLCLATAAAALTSSGCLLVAAGAAGGGAVAGYAYVKGKVTEVYYAGFTDTWAATHAALFELSMPVLKEELKGDQGEITSQTTDGDTIHIYVEPADSSAAPLGTQTRVSVRIATFGDHPVSDAILNQVGSHLARPAPAGWTPTTAAVAKGSIVQAGVTSEPPLAVPSTGTPPQTPPPPLSTSPK